MDLNRLLSEVKQEIETMTEIRKATEISSLAYDSRQVEKGAFFFAIEGMRTDGHLFVDQALERGAVAVASERMPPNHFPVAWIRTHAIRRFMAACANTFFSNPSQSLRLVGVTGTNGKTTTATLLHHIFQQDSPAFLMGTIQTIIGSEAMESVLTTPESIEIQAALKRAADGGCRKGVMEVSSHALALDRVFGCHFPVAVWTNLSQDHVDFHGSLENYFRAKSLLFQRSYNPGLEHAIINAEDPHGRRLKLPEGVTATLYGFSSSADIFPEDQKSTVDGTRLRLNVLGESVELHSPLLGNHNVYNVMAALAACVKLHLPIDQVIRGIESMPQVPGRFERVSINKDFSVVIDFAHSPDALANLLKLARSIAEGRIICLFGCGGDRDRAKRPLMGKIAAELADFVIVTSDNPRSEDPLRIVRDIASGLPGDRGNHEVIVDRREAIRHALRLGRQGDLILLAGKGHEKYQEIENRKIPFDERKIVEEALCSS